MRPLSRIPRESLAPRGEFPPRKPLIPRFIPYFLPIIAACLLSPAIAPAQNESKPDTSSPSASTPDREASADASTSLPDDPSQAQSSSQDPPTKPTPQTTASSDRLPQTKRILGIVPNFRAVSTDETLPPQTVKEKFLDATSDSFDYSSILIPGVLAAYSMATDAYPEFHQGAAGYARYFWHAAVDQTSENYMVEFIVPVVTREDTRYYTLGRGGFAKRAGYALSRAIITRTDAGNETFNISEVVGAGASAGLSSLYYPTRERSIGNTTSEWGLDVGIDAASFVVREFWPDINKHLLRQKTPIDSTER